MRNKLTEAELDSLLSRTPEFADRHFSVAVTRKTTPRITRGMVFLVALLGWVSMALLFGNGEVLLRLANELIYLTSNLMRSDLASLTTEFSVNSSHGIAILCTGAGLLTLLTNKLRTL